MRVREVTWRQRNDYSALMECEHCDHAQKHGGLYADMFFATRVIPSLFYCEKCGLNSLGEKRREPEHVQ